MAKTKKSNRKVFSDYSDLTIFVVVLLIVTLGVVVWLFADLTEQISRHKALENQSNQACIGVSIASNSGLEIDTNTLVATSTLIEGSDLGVTANQRCIVGGSTENETIQGKKIASYNFGAEVIYFKDESSAAIYAADKVYTQRNWNPDATGTNNTFVVTHTDVDYFDSYSVKGNTVMRISLPCEDPTADDDKSIEKCMLQADRTISLFNKKISPLQL